MPQSKLLYPYAYTSQIRLIARDPHDPDDEQRVFKWLQVEEESDDEVTTLDLSHEERLWERLRFQAEALLAEEELRGLIPPDAKVEDELRMFVGVVCSATRLREAVELTFDGKSWTGDIAVRRSAVRDVVSLAAFLVRRTDLLGDDAIKPEEPVATEHDMRVGEGRRLALVVDPPNRTLKGFVKTVWENFSESTDPIRKANDTQPYDLDLSGDAPCLVLNAKLEGMRAALHSRKRTGGAAVMRHATNAGIALSVWIQLFVAALASVEVSEETGELVLPSHAWKRRVLEALVDQLSSTMPRDMRLKNAAQLLDGQVEVLMPMLAMAAQRTIRMGRLVRDAERAAERFSDGQEG